MHIALECRSIVSIWTEPKAALLAVPKANEKGLSNTILEGEMLNFIKLILYSHMSICHIFLIASIMEDILIIIIIIIISFRGRHYYLRYWNVAQLNYSVLAILTPHWFITFIVEDIFIACLEV